MAKLTWSYHQNLQKDVGQPPTNEEKLQQISTPLEAIPASQVLENPRETNMNDFLDEQSVQTALHLTSNGTATGINGCPYELWKALEKNMKMMLTWAKQGSI